MRPVPTCVEGVMLVEFKGPTRGTTGYECHRMVFRGRKVRLSYMTNGKEAAGMTADIDDIASIRASTRTFEPLMPYSRQR